MCCSIRGAVFFLASNHIFITIILFIGSSFRAYRISSYEREENSKQLFGAVVIAIYFFILLVLGCLIFRGVEHKSPKMLGWSGGTFITLETFAFVFNLVLLSPMGGAYDEYGLRNFGFSVDVFQILLSLLFLGCMAGYCVVIILYIIRLREDDAGSEYTYGEFDDAGTIPAPPAATNLSRSSTAHSNYSVHHNNKSNNNTQLTQATSHSHLSHCNSQYLIGSGQNHQVHKSPQVQDRRIVPRVNHISQERLNTESTGTASPAAHYFLPQQQRQPIAYAPAVGAAVFPNYSTQNRWTTGSGAVVSEVIPCRQSQTLPHPHHYHRQLPTTFGGGGVGSTGTQFPSRSRMDLAGVPHTMARSNTVKRLLPTPNSGTLSRPPSATTIVIPTSVAKTMNSSYERDGWEQPRVQALKYNYASRKGALGSNTGIEV